ncbi:unnamed protein product [Cyclocybe aegerita]|uniref:DNA 3'-5' helicase n=1 Tax=Cyclocybe aegerita TaxID=1973307 RepID=A0A8S0W2N6_CYCAE|nr:unnamed protein product [Cyclocybe aegerita]
MDAINAQLEMRDVLIHVGTGTGKTAIAAGPHVHPSAKGKVSIMVSPLITLHDEMVDTFHEEFKLVATVVNSSNGRCITEKLKSIVKGDTQIILISLELLLSRRFIKEVLKNTEFKKRVLSVIIDEAHVISHWGSGFRKKYSELGIIRSFLLKLTPIVALSATLPARVRREVLWVLRFDQKNFLDIDIGNDQPNVSIVIRGIQHPLNTYADLDFVINKLAEWPDDILKSFIYCDSIAMGTEIIDHLTDLLPEHLQDVGIIRPYNACFSKKYRRAAMRAFKEGSVRILVCTDAAGMGCMSRPVPSSRHNYPAPEAVSSFRGLCSLPESGSSLFIRNWGHPDVAWWRSCPFRQAEAKSPPHPARSLQCNIPDIDLVVQWKLPTSVSAFVQRAGRAARLHDHLGLAVLLVEPSTYSIMLDEKGNKPDATPSGTDKTKTKKAASTPAEKAKAAELKKLKKNHAKVRGVQRGSLGGWHNTILIKARDFKDALFASDGLVSDEVVDLLANVGPIQCPEQLSAAVSGQWGWEETYGDELLQELLKLDIPPLIPLPTAPKAALKRPVVDGQEQGAVVTKKQKKTVKATQTANDLTGAQPLFVIEGYSQSPQMCRVCHLLEVLEEGEVQEHWMK